MGAISSAIVHLQKVKLSLKNDQRWLLLLSWFSIFFFLFFLGGGGGEDPQTPLFLIRKYVSFFDSTLLNTSL